MDVCQYYLSPARRRLLLVIGVALCLRLTALIALRHLDPSPDAIEDYLPIADSLLHGSGFLNVYGLPDIVRGPVYPLLIAAADLISPNIIWGVRLLQVALDIATLVVLGRLVTRLAGPRAGWCASWLWAVNPCAIYACALICPESAFTFLMTVSVCALVESHRRSQCSMTENSMPRILCSFGLSGALLGVATLCRATPMLLIVPWAALILVIPFRSATQWKFATTLAAGFVLTVAPWTIRNAVVFGEFIPVVSNGGANLYAGSQMEFMVPPPEHHHRKAARAAELVSSGVIAPRPEHESPAIGDRYNYQLGLANYRLQWAESKVELLQYFACKFGRLWFATQSGRHQMFVGASNLIWLAGGLVGFILLWRNHPQSHFAITVTVTTVAYHVAVFTVLYPLSRYVLGFTPLLTVGFSVVAAHCIPWLSRIQFEIWSSREPSSLSGIR